MPERSLLTRTLKPGSVGSDVQGVKRSVYRALNKDLHPLMVKPLAVQRTFGPFFLPDVYAVRRRAGLARRPFVDQALWQWLVRKGAPDALAISQMQRYIDEHPPPSYVFPIPSGQLGRVCQWLHQTAGIDGNWAIDVCCPNNTTVVAAEAGTVTKLSGHDPNQDTWDSQGVFGWSIHFETPAHYHYYVTHLGVRTVTVGMKLEAGSMIGRVGDQRYRPDHVHYGVSSPLGQVDAKKRITAVGKADRID